MANAETEENVESAKKKGGLVPLLAVGLVCLAAGGGGAWFFLGSGGPGGDAAAEAGADATGEEAEAVPPAGPPSQEQQSAAESLLARTVELAPFVVNINDNGVARYLKVKIELECALEEDKEQVEGYKARIRDAVIVLLSAKRLGDLQQFEGKLLLKDEIKDRINALFGAPRVNAVLFTEFVVQ
ncbi:MAG: flagellar basal body-associated FliL family protein [Myxococcota bacterium]|nr:flagellar basal body-associated FliL family protein [Myxococcales bacterium]